MDSPFGCIDLKGSLVVGHLSFVIGRLSFVVCRLSFVICRLDE